MKILKRKVGLSIKTSRGLMIQIPRTTRRLKRKKGIRQTRVTLGLFQWVNTICDDTHSSILHVYAFCHLLSLDICQFYIVHVYCIQLTFFKHAVLPFFSSLEPLNPLEFCMSNLSLCFKAPQQRHPSFKDYLYSCVVLDVSKM